MLKIAVIDAVPEQTLIFCDSDMVFLRSFQFGDLLVNGKIGLLDVDFYSDGVRRWTLTARKLLGLSQPPSVYRNYVGNMICWNRETVEAMRSRIEANIGMNWRIALARKASFSEYMLYGVFVRDVVGYGSVFHEPSSIPLVKPSWGTALTSEAAIDEFFSEIDPRSVGIMIHSKDNVNTALLRPHLEAHWKSRTGEGRAQ